MSKKKFYSEHSFNARGSERPSFRGPYAAQAFEEMAALKHTDDPSRRESEQERKRRERGKVYEAAKLELAAKRAADAAAASDPIDRISP